MTEQQPYEVVRRHQEFEVRRYPSHVVAEIVVQATFSDAGNVAFRTLVGYLNGDNRSRRKVPMTAPVLQRESEQIAMTSPVEQRETASGDYAVAFVLPASYTIETAPEPTRADVTLHLRPGALAAARRYRGRWTQHTFEHHRQALERALSDEGLVPEGPPTWARYNPPLTPWFLRRNEVVQRIAEVPVRGPAG